MREREGGRGAAKWLWKSSGSRMRKDETKATSAEGGTEGGDPLNQGRKEGRRMEMEGRTEEVIITWRVRLARGRAPFFSNITTSVCMV